MTEETSVANPGLSERLGSLQLATVDASELSQLIADEALRLHGGKRAVLWFYRPDLRRLFAEQHSQDIRSLDLDRTAAEELFREAAILDGPLDEIRYELVEASFGLAAAEGPEGILLQPITAEDAPMALLLVDEYGLESGELASELALAPTELDAFATQVGALIANQRALGRSRQHEAQLEALYETAREISGHLELELVLQAIIDRARHLVGTSISYITLVDSDRETLFMRATVGTRRPGFEDIRLRIGSGLGGVAAKDMHAVYTSDYLNDARFEHDPAVDADVRAEGIKSILGVPMTASREFVGVLYVADRAIRVFTDADVDILLSLARHAGLAIENAMLYERATAALTEARAANDVVAKQNRLLEQVSDAHRKLSEAVLEGKGLDATIDVIAELGGGHAIVLDERARVLAAGGVPSDDFGSEIAAEGLDPERDRELRPILRALPTSGTLVVDPRPPRRSRSRLVAPLIARAEVLGSIWLECDPEETDTQRPLVEETARVVALELLKERSVVEVERRLGRELLDELLAPEAHSSGSLERRALELGVDLSRPHRLAVAHTLDDALQLRLTSTGACAFVAEHGRRIVALIDGGRRDVRERLAAVVDEVEDSPGLIVVSSPCRERRDYRRQFQACDHALSLLGDYLTERVVDLDALGVLSLLLRDDAGDEVRRFVQSRIGALITHDRRHGAHLAETLEAYYQTRSSPSRAAAELSVHVNTVYYRLARVAELLETDYSEPATALDLQVALLARRLLSPDILESESMNRAENSVSEHIDGPRTRS